MRDMLAYALLLVLSVTCARCTARETAKDAYEIQSHACLVAFTKSADQRDCLTRVRANWTEAGAPPAATDGGSHE